MSCWSPCFGFFVCRCYNRRTHSVLEKPGAQNIIMCVKTKVSNTNWVITENEKKPNVFLKKLTGDGTKKITILSNPSFNKKVYQKSL